LSGGGEGTAHKYLILHEIERIPENRVQAPKRPHPVFGLL
jgi:hypothetical protein